MDGGGGGSLLGELYPIYIWDSFQIRKPAFKGNENSLFEERKGNMCFCAFETSRLEYLVTILTFFISGR